MLLSKTVVAISCNQPFVFSPPTFQRPTYRALEPSSDRFSSSSLFSPPSSGPSELVSFNQYPVDYTIFRAHCLLTLLGSCPNWPQFPAGRSTGTLNITGLGLKKISPEVMKMYQLHPEGGFSLSDSVDLVRLAAADNEFEGWADEAFPDVDMRDVLNE